ncbi:MAG TPA: hypothetical protein VF533_20070 [Solirubrobacteraceae bacterium]|jgi:hypothetical protein
MPVTRRLFARPLLLVLMALAALATAGCGNKEDVHTLGETEGVYVDVADLTYQIQMSRILNPHDVEDKDYLKGLPPGTEEPGRGEAWFGVFLRVSNPTRETLKTASSFRIIDTLENEFEPVPIDVGSNPFAYQSAPLRPESIYPDPNSAAGTGVIQGNLILFKVSLSSLQNRPLEFKIDSPLPPPLRQSATIDLDV